MKISNNVLCPHKPPLSGSVIFMQQPLTLFHIEKEVAQSLMVKTWSNIGNFTNNIHLSMINILQFDLCVHANKNTVSFCTCDVAKVG